MDNTELINLSASVTMHIDNVPINIVRNIVTQFVDDCTAYLQEVFALQNSEFHFTINGCDDIEL